VAIEIPSPTMYSTGSYLFPTGVPSARTSVTSMTVAVVPSQKNVATIAVPSRGFVGLNP